jgi:hypothetical protein
MFGSTIPAPSLSFLDISQSYFRRPPTQRPTPDLHLSVISLFAVGDEVMMYLTYTTGIGLALRWLAHLMTVCT